LPTDRQPPPFAGNFANSGRFASSPRRLRICFKQNSKKAAVAANVGLPIKVAARHLHEWFCVPRILMDTKRTATRPVRVDSQTSNLFSHNSGGGTKKTL
jgi:hypothetical protein